MGLWGRLKDEAGLWCCVARPLSIALLSPFAINQPAQCGNKNKKR